MSMILLAVEDERRDVDRRQRFPDEKPYCYQPLVGEEDQNRWNEETRQTVVKDYNLLDMYI